MKRLNVHFPPPPLPSSSFPSSLAPNERQWTLLCKWSHWPLPPFPPLSLMTGFHVPPHSLHLICIISPLRRWGGGWGGGGWSGSRWSEEEGENEEESATPHCCNRIDWIQLKTGWKSGRHVVAHVRRHVTGYTISDDVTRQSQFEGYHDVTLPPPSACMAFNSMGRIPLPHSHQPRKAPP